VLRINSVLVLVLVLACWVQCTWYKTGCYSGTETPAKEIHNSYRAQQVFKLLVAGSNMTRVDDGIICHQQSVTAVTTKLADWPVQWLYWNELSQRQRHGQVQSRFAETL